MATEALAFISVDVTCISTSGIPTDIARIKYIVADGRAITLGTTPAITTTTPVAIDGTTTTTIMCQGIGTTTKQAIGTDTVATVINDPLRSARVTPGPLRRMDTSVVLVLPWRVEIRVLPHLTLNLLALFLVVEHHFAVAEMASFNTALSLVN